jgi:hypothetical protein
VGLRGGWGCVGTHQPKARRKTDSSAICDPSKIAAIRLSPKFGHEISGSGGRTGATFGN